MIGKLLDWLFPVPLDAYASNRALGRYLTRLELRKMREKASDDQARPAHP